MHGAVRAMQWAREGAGMNGAYGEPLAAAAKLAAMMPTAAEVAGAVIFLAAIWLISGCRA